MRIKEIDFMDNLKLVESCFRGLGLTRLQIKTIIEKAEEYRAINSASGISHDTEEGGGVYGCGMQC